MTKGIPVSGNFGNENHTHDPHEPPRSHVLSRKFAMIALPSKLGWSSDWTEGPHGPQRFPKPGVGGGELDPAIYRPNFDDS